MPQPERPKTFSRKQQRSEKPTSAEESDISKMLSNSSQEEVLAESEADPYDFQEKQADRGAAQDQDSKALVNGSIPQAKRPSSAGQPERKHKPRVPAGNRTAANGRQPPVIAGSQHDPGFLQKLIAAQRERKSVWSSEDSSSSDEEAEDTAHEPSYIPSNHKSTRTGPARKPQRDQALEERGTDVNSQGSVDTRRAAPQALHSSDPYREVSKAMPKVPKPQTSADSCAPSLEASKAPPHLRGPAQEAARKRKEASQDMEVDDNLQPKTRPRTVGPGTPVALGASLLVGMSRGQGQETDMDSAAATSVMEAQESGEQFEIQDNVVYALDGLTRSASPAVRQESAAKIAEVCASQRGRLAMRADGLIQDVMAAGSKLALTQEPIVAVAFSAMLLAFSREKLHQAVLAQKDSLAVMGVLLEAHASADFRACQAKSACGALARLLRDSSLTARLPQSERACPSSLVLTALAGATDPQHSSTASEALKIALHEGGILQRLSDLATHHAKALPISTPRSAARSLWGLNRCLVAIENATFACAANEQHLVAVTVQRGDAAEPSSSQPLPQGPRAMSQPAAISSDAADGLPSQKASSQPISSSSPPHRKSASMRCGSEPQDQPMKLQNSTSGRQNSGKLCAPSVEPKHSSQAADGTPTTSACPRNITFPAWLVRQAQTFAPADKGVPHRGPQRDALQRMLSVLMNLTHNNGPGCSAVLGADGLQTVIGLIDALLGPPEEEADFVRIADRRRLLEGLDLTSTSLGLLINLVEHDSGCRPHLAALPLRHGMRALPLLCRLMQASGAVPEGSVPPSSGSPGLEVTEEQLLANEEEGAASIVEVYAALVLGFIIESDPALRQEVESLLEGGVATVTTAVRRCLQFYVNAGAITRSTEDSLRALLSSLQKGP